MKLYFPADITIALGGVENGLAKHILTATATPIRKGYGLTFIDKAACKAIGANRIAAAVLLINIVSTEEANIIPARTAYGPYEPTKSTMPSVTSAEVPVFSIAVAKGIIPAKSTTLSQLMVR